MKEKTINFRVDEKLKADFEEIARSEDLTSSQMLRAFMRETVDNKKPEPKAKQKAVKTKSVIPSAWRKK